MDLLNTEENLINDGDWIDGFMGATDNLPSPRIFRLWAGISCIGAVLERRVWARTAGSVLYPTLYVLLVGKPGAGKSQIIGKVSQLWYGCKEIFVASHSLTRASLTDELADAKKTMLGPNNELIEYHSLQIAASEFGVLVPAHDLEFLNLLNDLYDNNPNYRERRRTGNRKVEAINPQLNILAGTQPAYLASLLPEEAWGMGFMTRVIMVYSGEKSRVSLFQRNSIDEAAFERLGKTLKELLKVYGEVDWDAEVQVAIQNWLDAGCPPEPEHSRLANYNTRRIIHVIRLCIISAASAGHPLLITLSDFQRALNWLIAAEETMPEIFKEMVHRTDKQVIEELHMYAMGVWAKEQKLIHESRLIHFLQTKVTSDKIDRLLSIAVRANIFDKDLNGPFYRPRPKHEHGLE